MDLRWNWPVLQVYLSNNSINRVSYNNLTTFSFSRFHQTFTEKVAKKITWNATIVKLNTKNVGAAAATRRISDGWQSLRNRRLSNSLAPNNGRSWHRQKMCKTSFQGRWNWGDQGVGQYCPLPPSHFLAPLFLLSFTILAFYLLRTWQLFSWNQPRQNLPYETIKL